MELGDRVRDTLSGFTGIASGRAEYLTGCTQILVSPEQASEAASFRETPGEGRWIDVDRLEVDQAGAYRLPSQSSNGGPVQNPPHT